MFRVIRSVTIRYPVETFFIVVTIIGYLRKYGFPFFILVVIA